MPSGGPLRYAIVDGLNVRDSRVRLDVELPAERIPQLLTTVADKLQSSAPGRRVR
jgi:hypothetical protein